MKKDYLKYFAGLLLFGTNGVVASFISLSSYEIVLLRSLFGCILLILLFFVTGHRLTALHFRKDLCSIALSGIAMAADWLLLFEAYAEIGVSLSVLINYTGPAIVVALSPLLFKERITGRKLTALFAVLCGAVLISGQAVEDGIRVRGLVCAVLSAFSYAAMVISSKMAKDVEGMENSTLQLFFTFVTVAIFVLCRRDFHMEIRAGDWLPILWLGLINTGLGCYFYLSSIGRLPAQTVSICGYIEPMSSVLLSAVFLGESLHPLQICGALLIIAGAVCGETKTVAARTK